MIDNNINNGGKIKSPTLIWYSATTSITIYPNKELKTISRNPSTGGFGNININDKKSTVTANVFNWTFINETDYKLLLLLQRMS